MTRRQKREFRRAKIIRAVANVTMFFMFMGTEAIMIFCDSESSTAIIPEESFENEECENSYEVDEMVYVMAEPDILDELTYIVRAYEEECTETVETVEEKTYWDEVPLEENIQTALVNYCSEYSVPVPIALGLIEKESDFQSGDISNTNDYGLCQINTCNFEWLEEQLGITDFIDPIQNIECGMYILGRLYEKYQDWEMALICYNCGEYGAKKNYFSNGQYSNRYSRTVLELSEYWEAVVND